MLPFSELNISVPKPIGQGYTKNPQTVGNHIRNKRLVLKLRQYQVAEILEVNLETLRVWETRGTLPNWKYFPRVVEFLGYVPLKIDPKTFAGKAKLYCSLNGVTMVELSKLLGVGIITMAELKSGQRIDLMVEQRLGEMLSKEVKYKVLK